MCNTWRLLACTKVVLQHALPTRRYQEFGDKLHFDNIRLNEELETQKLNLRDINEFLTNELKARSLTSSALEAKVYEMTQQMEEASKKSEVSGSRRRRNGRGHRACALAALLVKPYATGSLHAAWPCKRSYRAADAQKVKTLGAACNTPASMHVHAPSCTGMCQSMPCFAWACAKACAKACRDVHWHRHAQEHATSCMGMHQSNEPKSARLNAPMRAHLSDKDEEISELESRIEEYEKKMRQTQEFLERKDFLEAELLDLKKTLDTKVWELDVTRDGHRRVQA
eukprot:365042-Chlamydomonas_euryale.AAC.26